VYVEAARELEATERNDGMAARTARVLLAADMVMGYGV
jgi:hypothetical protein